MKHNLNSKVIATGLFNVAEQINALDRVKESLISLNHIVMNSGQFRVLIQSKKIKGKLKVEILNSVLGELSHPLVNEVVSYLKGSGAANELREISNCFESIYQKKSNTIEVRGVVASKMSDQQIESFKISLDKV